MGTKSWEKGKTGKIGPQPIFPQARGPLPSSAGKRTKKNKDTKKGRGEGGTRINGPKREEKEGIRQIVRRRFWGRKWWRGIGSPADAADHIASVLKISGSPKNGRAKLKRCRQDCG